MKKTLLLFYALCIAATVLAQSPSVRPALDTLFNPTDIGFGYGDGPNGGVSSSEILPNGKILIGGGFKTFDGISASGMAIIKPDGFLDSTFNTGIGPDYAVSDFSIQPDEKIIVVGSFYHFGGIVRNHIARINSNGDLDTTFNPSTGANNNFISTVNLQPDGKIIVGGDFTDFNGSTRNRIARLNSDGSIDNTFNSTVGANNVVYATALQPDGKIIVGGIFTSINGTARNRIARLNTDGSLDNTFLPGTGANDKVNAIILQPDGKIIIVGNFSTYNGIARNRIVRLNTDGSLDNSFNIGTGASSTINTLTLQPDGKIIIGGQFTNYNGIVRQYIARLNTDGTLDASFQPRATNTLSAYTINILPNGQIIIGGSFAAFTSTGRTLLERLNADGSSDLTFNHGTGANNWVFTSAVQSDGKIIIGGGFTMYNGTVQNYIARLNVDGSLDTSFISTGSDGPVYTISIQQDGKIFVGGLFGSFNGISSSYIARLNPDGSTDPTFNIGTGANNWVYTSTIQPDGKIIIGGYFGIYNGVSKNRVARLNPDGSLDLAFNPGYSGGPSNLVRSIIVQPDNKVIICGDFTTYSGVSRNRIARLNTNGTLDNTFNPGTGANIGTGYFGIHTMALQPDGKIIIGGEFVAYNGVSRRCIARVNSDGSLDNSFDTGTGATLTPLGSNYSNGAVIDIHLQADGKIIIGGNFAYVNTISKNDLARLNPDGSVDNTYNTGLGPTSGLVSSGLISVNPQPDGKLIVTGFFNEYNGIGRNRIARLLSYNPVTASDSRTACDSFTWIDGNTYTTSNDSVFYNIAGGASNGLDSLVMLNLTIKHSSTGIDNISACDAYTWIDGNTYTTSNNTASYNIVGGAANGCDSIVSLNLTIKNSSTRIHTVTACNTYTWIDGNTYTTSNNTATHNIVGGAANGCDSIVTLNLTIKNSSTSIHTVTACNAYTWIDGNTYTTSNNTATYNIIGGASNGCDSLVTLNLTINHPSTGTHTISACDSYTWIDGNTYNSSNNTATYNIIGGASNGCDSLVTLNLTINHPSTGIQTVTACDAYTWIDGNTYTASNNTATYNIVGGASNGCDSIVTLNLTINHPSTGIQTVSACDAYTWIDGNTYTTSNNTATYNIVGGASNGCDSLVTLHLSFYTLDTSVSVSLITLTANATGANYQWLDCNDNYAEINGATSQTFIPSLNGTYAVALTQNNCSDTSSCFGIVVDRTVETDLTSGLRVYPNPFSSQTTLESDQALNNATLTISNSLGQTVIQINNIYGHSVNIERNNLVAGMYFIKLTEDSKPIKTAKIIIYD